MIDAPVLDRRWHRAWRLCGILGLVAVPVVCLLPMPSIPLDLRHTDKLEHLVGYAIATWWWAQLAPSRRRLWWQAAAFVVYGIVIEMLQALVPWRAGNDVWDVAANTLGILAATLFSLRWRLFGTVGATRVAKL